MEEKNILIIPKIRPKFHERHENITQIAAGAFAGLFNVVFGYPFDVIKTRI